MGIHPMNRPAVFLDRDGVLNAAVVRDGRPYPPASLAELVIAPDAADALRRLKQAGYRLVVVTNQPDVARGERSRAEVDAINGALASALPIDEIRVCCHDDRDRCACRKPAPGLLRQPPAHDLARSVIVGDRWRDIEAGRRAGVRATVLIDRGYREAMTVEPDARVRSLREAADWILASDPIARLRIKIFADGASLDEMRAWAASSYVRGFTTNPTLARQAGVRDYARFAHDALDAIGGRPISFEVLSDDFLEMDFQAREIASWGDNVYVKIPITNTRGQSAAPLIARLTRGGVKVNVTAVLTPAQVATAVEALDGGAPSNISIFAGRIADTGRDPIPIVERARAIVERARSIELIWASPREALNVYQADAAGCHIITVTSDILPKLSLADKDLDAFSLETVQMFRRDAVAAGFTLNGRVQLT
jgi:transaldolase